MLTNTISLEQPTVPVSGESRYLNPLWVSANEGPRDGPCQSDSSQSVTIGSELQAVISYKIRAALKPLFFREKHVLVQFWSPRFVGKHQLLTTVDRPFGVGVANEELCFYRRDSEHYDFFVDNDHEEEEGLSPPARVFKRGLPEWTSDVVNYKIKDFPQLDCAIRCNLHGYLALPVFDSTTELCVGVVELLTSSKMEDFAYEVNHIHQELQIWNLTSPQAFDVPASKVFNERRKIELDKIYDFMKAVCEIHSLPIAQTWTVSPSATCFAHEKVFEKSCSSFNAGCFRKVCLSTALPCYVRDMSAWPFMKASKERHLEMSRGVAGRALSSHGSCFCGDVTKLDDDEYPLVHNARMSWLTGCFAIFLHGVECDEDYVLEFFLEDNRCVLSLVQTLMHGVKAVSGFELGDGSDIEIVGPPADLSLNMNDSLDSESIVTDTSEPDYANVTDLWGLKNDRIEEISDNFTAEKSNLLEQITKRKRDSDTMPSTKEVMVNVTFNKSIKQFKYPLFLGLSKLKNEVAKRFKLEGQRFRLKYMDEDDDLILICPDDDLRSAIDASGSMKLICLEG